MKRRLLILSCSQTKLRCPESPITAVERYDGVFFRVLRKYCRLNTESKFLDVMILSAHFGLILANKKIPYYDKVMNRATAERLRPTVERSLSHRLSSTEYEDILVNVGRNYRVALPALQPLKAAIWLEGPIGKRASALKSWLEG